MNSRRMCPFMLIALGPLFVSLACVLAWRGVALVLALVLALADTAAWLSIWRLAWPQDGKDRRPAVVSLAASVALLLTFALAVAGRLLGGPAWAMVGAGMAALVLWDLIGDRMMRRIINPVAMVSVSALEDSSVPTVAPTADAARQRHDTRHRSALALAVAMGGTFALGLSQAAIVAGARIPFVVLLLVVGGMILVLDRLWAMLIQDRNRPVGPSA